MSELQFKYKPRSYLHFDAPINEERARALVTDAKAVARHSFYPFISENIVTRKVEEEPDGGWEWTDPKTRIISSAAHKDSHVFAHYNSLLENPYEEALKLRGLGECVTAFRSLGKNNIHFANEVFEYVKANSPCSVVAMDVSGFFDNLDHQLLKAGWARLLGLEKLPADHMAVFKAVTRHCRIDRERLLAALHLDPNHPRRGGRHRLCSPAEFRELVRGNGLCIRNTTEKGIPQGSPISAVLANLYMLEFDAALHAFVDSHGGLYRRYCDDILVVVPTADLREEAAALVEKQLASLRLTANPSKTEKIDFGPQSGKPTSPRPLNYLGFTFDGAYKRLRPASVARYYRKMRAGVLQAKLTKLRLDLLTPALRASPLRRRELYRRYSYLGHHNFLSYAFKAAKIMNDKGIKNQVKRHWGRLKASIKKSVVYRPRMSKRNTPSEQQ